MLHCKACKNKVEKTDKYCSYCGVVFKDETSFIDNVEVSKNFKESIKYYTSNDYTTSLNYIEKALNEDNENKLYLFWRAYILISKKEYKKANLEFDKLLLKGMKNTAALFWNGYTYSLEKKPKTASRYFKTILEIDQNNILGILGEGLSLMENRNYDDALKSFNKVLEIDNENIKALNYKTNLLFYLRRYDEAIELINNALEYHKENEDLILTKLSILGSLEKYEELIEFSEYILKIPELKNETKMAIYYYKGRIALENKEKEDIIKNYTKTIKYSKDKRDTTYNSLAEIYQKVEKEDFNEILNEIILNQKDNPYLYLFKGNMEFNQEQYEMAEKSYNEALKYDNENIEVLKSLYEVKDKLGKKEELLKINEKIVEAEKLQFQKK